MSEFVAFFTPMIIFCVISSEELFFKKNKDLKGGMNKDVCRLHDSWAKRDGEARGFDQLEEWCEIFMEATGADFFSLDCSDMFDFFRLEAFLKTVSADCVIGDVVCECCADGWTPCCYDENGVKQCISSTASMLTNVTMES